MGELMIFILPHEIYRVRLNIFEKLFNRYFSTLMQEVQLFEMSFIEKGGLKLPHWAYRNLDKS